MRYEVWHATHLLVYVALTLAFFHQTANGEELRHTPWARYAWTTLWVAVAAVIVWSRWLRPVVLAARHRLAVAAVHPETADTVSVEITGRRLERFPGEAGQYFRWRLLTAGRWLEAHPYSLSAEPDGRRLRLTATGPFGRGLRDLAPGTRIVAEGPCGGLVAPDRWTGPIVLIGGGYGATPLRALFAICYGGALTFIYRGHCLDRMPLRAELDAIAERRGAQVHYLVGSRDEPGNQLTAARLESICPEVRLALTYVCGSGSFVRHVRAALVELGVPDRRIRAESFELE
jgi:ferredoxin-NADP reductase